MPPATPHTTSVPSASPARLAAAPPPRSASRMRRRQWLVGAAVTLIASLACITGLTASLERPTIDWRTRWHGGHNASPSPAVVIVGIDDQSLRTVQRWPWDRVRLAEAVHEIRRAGAKTIALDVLLEEAENPAPDPWFRDGDVDGDRTLAEELGAAPPVVLPIRLRERDERLHRPGDPDDEFADAAAGESFISTRFSRLVRRFMSLAPGATEETSAAAQHPHPEQAGPISPRTPRTPHTPRTPPPPPPALPGAVRASALREFALEPGGPKDDAAIPRRLTPSEESLAAQAWRAARWLQSSAGRSSSPMPTDAPNVATASLPIIPAPSLLPADDRASRPSRLGDVSGETFDPDGVTRHAALFTAYNGRLWQAFGLAAACDYLDIPAGALELRSSGGSVDLIIPLGGGDERRLPLVTARLGDAETAVGCLLPLAWPKTAATWRGQFSPQAAPSSGADEHDVSIGYVMEPALIRRAIDQNLRQMDRLVKAARAVPLGTFESWDGVYEAALKAVRNDDALGEPLSAAAAAAGLAAAAARDFLEFNGEVDPSELTPEQVDVLHNCAAVADGLPALAAESAAGVERAARVRARLLQLLQGKLVFIGWTATGAAADVVHTSIHPRTPGVYIHAAVANALLTGFARTPTPPPVDLGILLTLGILGTVIGVRAPLAVSPLLIAALLASWSAVSGGVLWDRFWIISPYAGPGLVAGSSWLAVLLHRVLVEQRARRRTEEQFRSYVAPGVVDILVANPSLGSLAPQRRTLTVLMADLQGFTALAERVGEERTAQILGTYLGAMTRILLARGATIDKYLGDGIMAFWGAPLENPAHARDACLAALDMAAHLKSLNDAEAFGPGERLGVRIGVASGDLMVGDFGCPPYRSSYTVLGDAANLASRLEGANRLFGATILASANTHRSAGSDLHWLPVGRLRLRGRLQPEDAFELVAAAGPSGGPISVRASEPDSGGVRTEEAVFMAGVAAFSAGDLVSAERCFGGMATGRGERAGVAGRYLREIARIRRGTSEIAGPDVVQTGLDGTIDATDL